MNLDAVGASLRHAYALSVVALVLALAVSYAFRHKRAAIRHHIWLVSIGVALLVPAARTVAAPQINMPVFATIAWSGTVTDLVQSPTSGAEHRRDSSESNDIRSPLGSQPSSANAAIGVLWLSGLLPLLSIRLLRRARLARLVRAAQLVGDDPNIPTHEDIVVPMVAGIRDPTVLLPSSVTQWSRDEVNAVVIHERAHVMRRDHVVAVMIDLATAVYWLNPLMWMAAQRVEHEREQACDNEVLYMGTRPSLYAAILLRVADLAAARSKQSALAMDSGRLDKRIRAVLSDSVPCSGDAPFAWLLTVLTMVFCAWLLSTVNLVARVQAPPGEETLATVNGEAFTRVDLDRFETLRVGAQRVRVDPTDFPLLLVDALDEALVVQRGKVLGFTLSDDQFRSVLENIKAQRGLQNEMQFREALAQLRLTEDQLRLQLERQMIMSRLKFNVVSQRVIVTTDEQAWSEYVAVLRAEATIEWKALDLQRAYENGLARAPR